MQLNLGRIRPWLYRGLVAVAASLVVLSAINPWWIGDVWNDYIGYIGTIEIYQYGLSYYGFFAEGEDITFHLAADETPFYQNMLAWIYIAISVGLILFSTRLKGRKGSWLLGGIGLIYIAYAAVAAFIVIAGRLGDYNVSLQGWSPIIPEIPVEDEAEMLSSLQFGYYLAYAAGFMCIALALLRSIIIGKSEFDTQ